MFYLEEVSYYSIKFRDETLEMCFSSEKAVQIYTQIFAISGCTYLFQLILKFGCLTIMVCLCLQIVSWLQQHLAGFITSKPLTGGVSGHGLHVHFFKFVSIDMQSRFLSSTKWCTALCIVQVFDSNGLIMLKNIFWF